MEHARVNELRLNREPRSRVNIGVGNDEGCATNRDDS
jgi:hypothetical protein